MAFYFHLLAVGSRDGSAGDFAKVGRQQLVPRQCVKMDKTVNLRNVGRLPADFAQCPAKPTFVEIEIPCHWPLPFPAGRCVGWRLADQQSWHDLADYEPACGGKPQNQHSDPIATKPHFKSLYPAL